MQTTQLRRGGTESVEGRVGRDALEVTAEDRPYVRSPFVPGPALDVLELPGIVQRDVDRAVATFRQAADRAGRRLHNRAVPRVDRLDKVARHERRPPVIRPDAVHPLLVSERPRRAERHHEDHRLTFRVQLVLDDAQAHGKQERQRTPRKAVQEVHHGVALARMSGVPRREVDVHLLAAAAERRARDRDALLFAALLHVPWIGRRRKAAVEPVVPAVATDTDEADREEHSRDGEGAESKRARQGSPARPER